MGAPEASRSWLPRMMMEGGSAPLTCAASKAGVSSQRVRFWPGGGSPAHGAQQPPFPSDVAPSSPPARREDLMGTS